MNSETVIISDHALERFMERTGCKTKQKATETVRRMLSRGKEVSRSNAAIQFLRYREPAEYWIYNNWLFVVAAGKVVRTCYEIGLEKSTVQYQAKEKRKVANWAEGL